MKRRTKIVAAAVAAIVLIVGGGGVWYFVLQDDAPPEAAVDCDGEPRLAVAGEGGGTGDAGDAADAELEGEWVLVQTEEVFVGYRIEEVFGGDTLKREVAGRTPLVDGSLTADGTTITEVTMIADLTALESDQARRDRFTQTDALEIDDFPKADFVLTEPIDLGSVPAVGKQVSVEAVGELTLHGVTREVTMSIEACWWGSSIDVAGSTPIVLADYDIDPPDIGGLVKVDGDGTLEFQLTFQPATTR